MGKTREHVGSGNSEKSVNESCFVRNHMEEHHIGMSSKLFAKVTHGNKDTFSRHVRELIRRSIRNLMNTKYELFQPPVFRVMNEVVRE